MKNLAQKRAEVIVSVTFIDRRDAVVIKVNWNEPCFGDLKEIVTWGRTWEFEKRINNAETEKWWWKRDVD